MIIWFYERTRLKRSAWQAASIILLIALLCGFFAFFDGFIREKEGDMDAAYEAIPVNVVVSNLTGTKTDHLEIADYIIHYFLSDQYAYGGELQNRAFSSYVRDVRLKASVYYSQGTGFTDRQKLSGLTSIDAAPELSDVSAASVTYFGGYSEAIFSTDAAVCILPDFMLETLPPDTDGGYRITLSFQMSPSGTAEPAVEETFRVVGTYPSESQTIYCPFSRIAKIQTELDGKVTADSLSATVRDNHELDAFRQILMRHFAEVDPSGHQKEIDNSPVLRYQQYAITVHDETLRETLDALNRNLQTLYRLKPIFAVIEITISAAAGFFYMHVRRREFAIARSLGTKRHETIGIAFVEVCILFLLGLALSSAAIFFVGVTVTHFLIASAIFLAAEAGAVTACRMATGRNGVRILREAE